MVSYVITGAARGIGLEFVRQLSSDTRNIVFALVRSRETAGSLEGLQRSNVKILEANITDTSALKLAAEEVSRITNGKLDVLINNAALIQDPYFGGSLDDYPNEQTLKDIIYKMTDTNVLGVIYTINAFLPLLKNGAEKKVITLGSGVGDYNFTLKAEDKMSGPYSISKAAVVMVVAKYAVKYKNDGFIFLTISPGLVDTSNKEPTEGDLKAYGELLDSIRRYAPGFSGAITPEQSVTAMLRVLDGLSVADTGKFISHKGNQEWV